MDGLEIAWLVIACVASLYWIYWLYVNVRVSISVPAMAKLNLADLEAKLTSENPEFEYPKLSIVGTACNEEDTLEDSMNTRLATDYPNVEFVMVDDRSTDKTSVMLDGYASKDKRVKVVHLTEIPEGWLGKINAMNEGMKTATGDWILFSDPDVHMKPATLKLTVAYAESRKLDHLAVMPEIWPNSFLLGMLFTFTVRALIVSLMKIWAVENPKSKTGFGAGAFNLVRRKWMEKINGFTTMKAVVSDDVKLGVTLKRTGAKSSMLNGRGLLGLYSYKSFHAFKTFTGRVPIYLYEFPLLFVVTTIMLISELFPIVGLFNLGADFTIWFALPLLLIHVSLVILHKFWIRMPIVAGLLSPIGFLLIYILLFWGGLFCGFKGGIDWRGTFYPIKMLRK